MIGTWIQRVALSWMVYRMTGSAFLLGLVGFAGQIPAFLLAPFAGVLADRYSRHRILLMGQILAMLQALILSILVLMNVIRIWEVIALSIVLGIINAFQMPTLQAFTVEMVDKKDLGNAIAINATMINIGRLLGPSVAGILIAAVGEGACFLINAVSYVAVIASLLLMKLPPMAMAPRHKRAWQEFKEGFVYAAAFTPIRDILLMFALVNLVAMPCMVLMPVFAKDLLEGGPRTMGFLMAFVGFGALAGAVHLASRKSVLGVDRLIPIAAATVGVMLMIFSMSRILAISLGLMLLTGVGQMIVMAGSNTLLQTLVDDDKRGRVMSFYTMAFMGTMPVGSLIAGFLANRIGAPLTVFIDGSICVVGALIFARRLPGLKAMIHPIYLKLGIIPEAVADIRSAVEMSADPE